MIQKPERKKRVSWWVWLFVILFPIPLGVVHWWVTLIFMAIFAIVMWAIAANDN